MTILVAAERLGRADGCRRRPSGVVTGEQLPWAPAAAEFARDAVNDRRMRSILAGMMIALLVACAPGTDTQTTGSPGACTPEVNRQIGDLIERGERAAVDNVAVCGTTFNSSRSQRAGRYGGHQLIPVQIRLPDGHSALVEVVTNDDLDGRVTAPRGADVYALGQYYRTTARQRPYVAGVHDVHCATHRGAANGFVVVNGRRAPAHC